MTTRRGTKGRWCAWALLNLLGAGCVGATSHPPSPADGAAADHAQAGDAANGRDAPIADGRDAATAPDQDGVDRGDAGVDVAADRTPLPTIAEADFIPALQRIWCDDLVPCCTRDQRAFDLTSCRAYVEYRATIGRLFSKPYDATVAAGCVARSRAATAACTLDPVIENWVWGLCAQTYGGTVPLGAPCGSSQCRGSPDGPVSCSLGVCRTFIIVGSGGACVRQQAPAPMDYFCSSPTEMVDCDGVIGRCRQVAAIGESCRDISCNPGAYCHPSLRVCVARLAPGSVCGLDGDCEASSACVDERCVRRAGIGDPCGATTACAPGQFCDHVGPAAAAPTCALPRPIGSACTADEGCTAGPPPLGQARCVAGRCVNLALPTSCIMPAP